MMICLAAIFMLWYNPRKQRRMVLDAVQELEFEQFTACNDGKVLRIRIQQSEDETEQIPESRIPLATAYVQEFEEFYLVCDGKKMFVRAAEISTGAVRRSTAGAVSRGSVTVSRETWTASGDMSADTAQLVPEPFLQSNPAVSASHCQLPFQGSQIMQHCLMFT